MESQPQNPEFRINPENFHQCNQKKSTSTLWLYQICSFWYKYGFFWLKHRIIPSNERHFNPTCTDGFTYCKFEIFCENFIFAHNFKRHVCNDKNLQLKHDLPTSVNGRVISPFCEGFIFRVKFCENKTLAKILNLQY